MAEYEDNIFDQPSTSSYGLTKVSKKKCDMDPTLFHLIAADIKKYKMETSTPTPQDPKPEKLKANFINHSNMGLASEYIMKKTCWPVRGQVIGKCSITDKITQQYSVESFRLAISRERKHFVDIDISKLVKRIEENTELLVQLEYLTRGTSPREVRDCHVKLILQLMRCHDASWHSWTFGESHTRLLVVTDNTPLYVLGAVFSTVYTTFPVCMVVASKKMKPVCQLFIDICHDVKLYQNTLAYVNVDDIQYFYEGSLYMSVMNDLQEHAGCTGVITEHYSDLHSAIEVISKSSSSVTAPWRFTQLYVHITIIEQLLMMMAANTSISEDDSFIINDKTFFIKRSGDNNESPAEPMDQEESVIEDSTESVKPGYIHVYTYSSIEELQLNTPYLSVWDSKKAHSLTSHTLALRSKASAVWINGHATFEGPSRTALAIYRLYHNSYCRYTKEGLQQLIEPWKKKNFSERFESIIEGQKKYFRESICNDRTMFKCEPETDNVFQVTEDALCFGIRQETVGNVIFMKATTIPDQDFNILKAVLYGSVVIFEQCYKFAKLSESGLPFQKCKTSDKQPEIVQYPLLFERYKMVWIKL